MQSNRKIVKVHRGNQHSTMIRRLIDPSDLGQILKPFVFLDYLNANVKEGFGFGFHSHSGIATLTYQQGADIDYEDTSGQRGVVKSGGLEWMQAGGGVWHRGFLVPVSEINGFQLWVALPPEVEDGDSQGLYIPPTDVPVVGNVKVLLGQYMQVCSPIPTPSEINYFDLSLTTNERWIYQPPVNHSVAWCFIYRGEVLVSGQTISDELVIFDSTEGAIEIEAIGEANVLIGTAVKHDYPLFLGYSSVHTNAESLRESLLRIEKIGETLRSQALI